MRIPGDIKRRLEEAFRKAFDRSALKIMVETRLDEQFEELVRRGNLREQVHELLTWAQQTGRLEELADAACAERPGNQILQTACDAVRDHLRKAGVDSDSSSASVTKRLPFWNVPNRNDFFTGREELLKELEARLEASRSAAITQAITGLGGVGKTQVAIEYCHRHRSDYEEGVYWADASSAGALEAEYARLAVARGFAGPDTPVDEAVPAFLQELARRSGWLMVLDNADDIEAIRDLMPPNTGGRVLVTTRVQNPDLGRAQPLAIDVLLEEQATKFLLERAGREGSERAAARDLAETLGFLPLALEQAGAYLARHPVDIGAYLESFKKLRLDLVERQGPARGHYEATVATTWEISFEKLEAASPAAAEALRACGFLAPDEIPLELFTTTGDRLGPALGALAEEVAEDPLAAHEQLIEPLTRYSLANFDRTAGGRFSLHRLVQEVIRQRLENQDLTQEVSQRVHRALEHCFPSDPESPESWPAGSLWLPHVKASLVFWLNFSTKLDWDPTGLWDQVGTYAWSAGRASEARFLKESTLSVRRRVLGEEHPSTLISINNLAVTLRDLGDVSGAKDLHETALSVKRRVLGEEHPATLNSMHNLAVTLRDLGDISDARALQESALLVRRRVLGEEHPSTLISMNQLAVTLKALGESSGARELHESALSVSRRVLGEEHPGTLMLMNNLAETLRALGESSSARELHESALSVRRRVLGEEHPDTLMSMHNLCYVQAESDDLELDPQLVEQLLSGVQKLPEGTPIRVAAEERWLKE